MRVLAAVGADTLVEAELVGRLADGLRGGMFLCRVVVVELVD